MKTILGTFVSLMLIGLLIFQGKYIRNLNRERRGSGHRYPRWAIAAMVLAVIAAAVAGAAVAANTEP